MGSSGTEGSPRVLLFLGGRCAGHVANPLHGATQWGQGILRSETERGYIFIFCSIFCVFLPSLFSCRNTQGEYRYAVSAPKTACVLWTLVAAHVANPVHRQRNIFGVSCGITLTGVYHGVNTNCSWYEDSPWLLLISVGASGAPNVRVSHFRVKRINTLVPIMFACHDGDSI